MYRFIVVAILGTATWLNAQTVDSAQPSSVQVASSSIDFGPAELTPLGQKGTVMSAETTCTPDGALFLEIADSPQQMNFVLHSLTNGKDDIRFAVGHLQGYRSITWPLEYFASDSRVVAIVDAEPEDNQLSPKNRTNPATRSLALIYDRSGSLQHAVPIPFTIEPKAVGLYGSGDLLIVSIDPLTKRSRLFILDDTGEIKNELSLFDSDYTTKKSQGKQPLASLPDSVDNLLSILQIFPYGDDLLLVPRSSAAEVIEVNEHGVVRSTELQLPPGQTINTILSAGKSSWVVSTFAKTDVVTDPQTGKGYGVFRQGPLFQFNPADGSLIRRIDLPKDVTASVACEHDGDFTGLTTDRQTGRLEVLKGSAK